MAANAAAYMDFAWIDESRHDDEDVDQRVVLHNVSWEAYEGILEALGDSSGARATYLEGTLELMSPGAIHEEIKKLIASLLETYALEIGPGLHGRGSTTFRRKKKDVGVEPDESYTVGEKKKRFPDLAIEVVVSGWKVDRLEAYARLRVAEVWIWRKGALHILGLRDGAYTELERSSLFPELDLDEFSRFIRMKDTQTSIMRAYRDALQTKKKR